MSRQEIEAYLKRSASPGAKIPPTWTSATHGTVSGTRCCLCWSRTSTRPSGRLWLTWPKWREAKTNIGARSCLRYCHGWYVRESPAAAGAASAVSPRGCWRWILRLQGLPSGRPPAVFKELAKTWYYAGIQAYSTAYGDGGGGKTGKKVALPDGLQVNRSLREIQFSRNTRNP